MTYDVKLHEDKNFKCVNLQCDPNKFWDCGYGLAGGGIGAYTYCTLCNQVVSKVQDIPQGSQGDNT